MGILTKKNITSRIMSVLCFELFKSQNKNYKKSIWGNSKVNISIEAGSSMGWNEVCPNNLVHASIDKFGASAPYKKLYDFYGLTASKIYKKISGQMAGVFKIKSPRMALTGCRFLCHACHFTDCRCWFRIGGSSFPPND